MNAPFAPSAVALCTIAARVLGWRPHEFWRATPAELALSLGADEAVKTPPTRAEIKRLIERESADARSH